MPTPAATESPKGARKGGREGEMEEMAGEGWMDGVKGQI